MDRLESQPFPADSKQINLAAKRSAPKELNPARENKRREQESKRLIYRVGAGRCQTSNSNSKGPFPRQSMLGLLHVKKNEYGRIVLTLLKPAGLEERNGEIEYRVVNNDGSRESMIVLTGLKCLFQKQLPKMPKDYIARLVYDRTHLSIAIVKTPLEVIGGITYRQFSARRFAEIVFCAVSASQQVKGYGAHIMVHLKDHVKATSPVTHFMTYADNYATGYFQKQGFTREITLDRSIWMGYIKDYEGGTLMQCSLVSRIRYLEVGRLLMK